MLDKIETNYLKVIRGEQLGLAAMLIRGMLHPLSWLYRGCLFFRNKAYDLKILKTYAPQIPTIVSIGNIVAGGTGKTPVTLMLAKDLVDKFPVAILCRGYRSYAEQLDIPLVLSQGNGPEHPSSFCGDEPYLLAKNQPKAHVFVGKNRCQAVDMAAERGAKLAILDDGMQHRQLARDFEVVVMDAKDPFGQGYLLPRGLLREDLSALKRADIIILNNIESPSQFYALRKEIAQYTAATAVGTIVKVISINKLGGGEVASLRGKKIGMFCGIAKPSNFAHTLENMGAVIVDQLHLGDHKTVDYERLAQFSNACLDKGAEYILCTEKDWVKLPDDLTLSLPIAWTNIELEVTEGAECWKEFVKKTVKKAHSGNSDTDRI